MNVVPDLSFLQIKTNECDARLKFSAKKMNECGARLKFAANQNE